MGKSRFEIPGSKVKAFCEKYDIKELSLFGSVLSDDFSEDSDIDILVTFSDNSHHTVFDLVRMEKELQEIFGYEIDLVSRRGLESSRNYIRKNAILNSTEAIYAA
ncbi:MAG: nucleotidyltransferase domain-containing protein [Deltaproteobacteria bacterium]|nr:nucleotidyltransferase domain-containing protein [Deltaproteobacteria bacterium]